MPRAIWKGSIRFGLVNIPVGLVTAEKPGSDDVHFHLLDRRDLKPIHYRRVNGAGKEVPWEDTVRGYEYEKGKYLALSDGDLKRASPEATRTIDILAFVDVADISPLFFLRPYYLSPEKTGAKSYALLRETLRRSGKAGIAKVVIRTREYLAAMLTSGDAIVIDLLRFAHELRDTAELDLPTGKQGVSAKELAMAERLVNDMVGEWRPEDYADDYQEALQQLIAQRVKAGRFAPGKAPSRRRAAPGKVVDLMSLLKQSVQQGGRRPPRAAPSRPAARNRQHAHRRPASA